LTAPAAFFLLALEGSGEGVSFALFTGGHRAVYEVRPEAEAASLPLLLAASLAGKRAAAIAVLIGPGRFTGLRATLAVAEGLALGWEAPLWGLSVGDVITALAPQDPAPLWVATPDGREGLFIETETGLARHGPEALPVPPEGARLAGEGAEILEALARREGRRCRVLPWRAVRAAEVGEAALRLKEKGQSFRPPHPLYVGTVAFRPRPGWTLSPRGEAGQE
jgi:tRNA threonylcarbamoyladenosine biosynthesis protein TsaB